MADQIESGFLARIFAKVLGGAQKKEHGQTLGNNANVAPRKEKNEEKIIDPVAKELIEEQKGKNDPSKEQRVTEDLKKEDDKPKTTYNAPLKGLGFIDVLNDFDAAGLSKVQLADNDKTNTRLPTPDDMDKKDKAFNDSKLSALFDMSKGSAS